MKKEPWYPKFDHLRPPGTYFETLSHPSGKDSEVEVAIMQDHRFAFFYWLKWINTLQSTDRPPVLLSLDWHKDLAPPTEQEKEDLGKLDRTNWTEAALFTWGRLNPYNDGHILSAAYLDLIDHVHIVCKQEFAPTPEIVDYKGRKHEVFIYDSISELEYNLPSIESSHVFFDIDLDYFTETQFPFGGGEDVELVSEYEVRETIHPKSVMMKWIFEHLAGMTIATEPVFCGGIHNSDYLLNILDEELFTPSLLHPQCQWKHLV